MSNQPTESPKLFGPGPCACIETIRQKLETLCGPGSEVDLELKTVISFGSADKEATLGQALPPLYYTYKVGKKRKKSYITFSFCPFCGQGKSHD